MFDSSATVQGRIFIVGDEVREMQLFVYELFPFDAGRRPLQEWAECHIQEYDAADLRELFKLPAEGDFQVLFTGKLSGRMDSYSGEWDEDFDVIESKSEAIPAGWFDRFGFSIEESESN